MSLDNEVLRPVFHPLICFKALEHPHQLMGNGVECYLILYHDGSHLKNGDI